jgi:hypothetical protein
MGPQQQQPQQQRVKVEMEEVIFIAKLGVPPLDAEGCCVRHSAPAWKPFAPLR